MMRALVVFLIVLVASVAAGDCQYDNYYGDSPDCDPQPLMPEPGEMEMETASGGGGLITPSTCDAPTVNSSNCIVPRPALQPHLRTENEALDLAECYLNCLEMVSSGELLY